MAMAMPCIISGASSPTMWAPTTCTDARRLHVSGQPWHCPAQYLEKIHPPKGSTTCPEACSRPEFRGTSHAPQQAVHSHVRLQTAMPDNQLLLPPKPRSHAPGSTPACQLSGLTQAVLSTVPAVLTSTALLIHCFLQAAYLICLCMDDELHQSPFLPP